MDSEHDNENTYPVCGVTIYPKKVHYQGAALLTLGKRVNFNRVKAMPACLPYPKMTLLQEGSELTMSGWGYDGEYGGTVRRKLQLAQLNLKTPTLKKDCKINGGKFLKKKLICATRGTGNPCHLDYGG